MQHESGSRTALLWLVSQRPNVDLAVQLFAALLVVCGAAAGLYWLHLRAAHVTSCVKVERVEWTVPPSTRSPQRLFPQTARDMVMHASYRVPGSAELVRSGSWLQGRDPRNEAIAQGWADARCTPIWYHPDRPSRSEPHPPSVPFTEPFGWGQLSLLALCVLAGLREALRKLDAAS